MGVIIYLMFDLKSLFLAFFNSFYQVQGHMKIKAAGVTYVKAERPGFLDSVENRSRNEEWDNKGQRSDKVNTIEGHLDDKSVDKMLENYSFVLNIKDI